MIQHLIRIFAVVLFILCGFSVSVPAQDQLVKFHPVGEPKYCKACGHLGQDYWTVTIRLENISGSDLIIYGRELGRDFFPLNGFQHRNPNICEWEYSYGGSSRRVPWNEMPDHERVPLVFKAGEIIDSHGDFGRFEGMAAKRYSAFIGRSPGIQPTEIFSTPFVPVYGETPDAATFRLDDNTCTPQCKIGISESPKIGGVQLGMSLGAFRVLYPQLKVSTIFNRPDSYMVAYIWAWELDAYSINVTFINDKVERIEPKFKSLDKARERDDFWQYISSTIGLPYFWEPFQGEWKCRDFRVEITPNPNPAISIHTPQYIRVRDRLNEEALKKE